MPTNRQTTWLEEMRTSKKKVRVYLMNGFQMDGIILGYDIYTISLLCKGSENIIFKHAISTFVTLAEDTKEPTNAQSLEA